MKQASALRNIFDTSIRYRRSRENIVIYGIWWDEMSALQEEAFTTLTYEAFRGA